jgi:surfactin synthase thioesterase subunit
MPGGHFFLRDDRDALADRLNATLRPFVQR